MRQIYLPDSLVTWPKRQHELFKKEDIEPITWNKRTRLLFIGEAPSIGKRPRFFLNFLKLLEKHGIKNYFMINLSDFIRDKPKLSIFWDSPCVDILRGKIKLLEPQRIISIGKNTERILKSPKSNIDISILSICHYSRNNPKKQLEKNMKKLGKEV